MDTSDSLNRQREMDTSPSLNQRGEIENKTAAEQNIPLSSATGAQLVGDGTATGVKHSGQSTGHSSLGMEQLQD